MILEITEFIIYSSLIVLIAKYVLVKTLRNLAENLDLKPKTVGNIAGYATSIPELLTVSISSINGLVSTSIFNILSSNIINFVQYILSIVMNKNIKKLNNIAIRIDIVMVIITIIIPIFLISKDIEINIGIVPIFLIIFLLFYYLNNNAHKIYLEKEDMQITKQIEADSKKEKGNTRKTLLYITILIGTGILLYLVGDLLGKTLDNLCNEFRISQTIIGILLGIITSIPELVTFFESQKYNNNKMIGVVETTNNLLTSNIVNLFIVQSVGMIFYNILN